MAFVTRAILLCPLEIQGGDVETYMRSNRIKANNKEFKPPYNVGTSNPHRDRISHFQLCPTSESQSNSRSRLHCLGSSQQPGLWHSCMVVHAGIPDPFTVPDTSTT